MDFSLGIDYQARNLLKFAADNSSVEWRLNIFSDGKNYVTTSQLETSEDCLVGAVVNKEFGHQPMGMLTPRLLENDHSHPMGLTSPSGLYQKVTRANEGET